MFHFINRGRKRSLSSLSVVNLRMKLDNLAEVVGCIAGDDTIFIAARTAEGAINVAREIRKIINV